MICTSGFSICGYILFHLNLSINYVTCSNSYCNNKNINDAINVPISADKKVSSGYPNIDYLQLRPIVNIIGEEKGDHYYENVDIEKDEREKFFFIETSQKDHLRTFSNKLTGIENTNHY